MDWATTSDQMRRGTGACGGEAGGLGAAATDSGLTYLESADSTVAEVMAATLNVLSANGARRRAGGAARRSHSGAERETVTPSVASELTTTVSDDGAG
jgi:hypothetical protein